MSTGRVAGYEAGYAYAPPAGPEAILEPQAASDTVFARLQARCGMRLEQAAAWLDGHAWVMLLVLGVLYGISTWTRSLDKLLWHDELFTYYIAQAPTWAQMIHLNRTLDLNPPMLYTLARLSMHAFGVGAQTVRLPSMLGYALCAWCVYMVTRRWTGSAAWGFVGLLTLIGQSSEAFAFEARPYGIEMGFITLGVLGWQRATEAEATGRRRAGWILVLLVGGVCGLLSHVFALLPWCILIAAEAVRVLRRRRLDWLIALALILPFAVTPLYKILLSNHGVSAFPKAFQPTFETLITFYTSETARAIRVALPGAILALVALGSGVLGYVRLRRVHAETIILLLGLLAAPAVLILYLLHGHGAFFPRYGFCFELALALALPVGLAALLRDSRAAGLVVMAAMFLICKPLLQTTKVLRHPKAAFTVAVPGPCNACALAAQIDPALPIAVAGGTTYVEMNYRESPQQLKNIYYVADVNDAIQFAHATIFEGMQYEHDSFPFRAQVDTYTRFVAEHPRFFVYGTYEYPEEWLLRKLLASGADLQMLGTVNGEGYLDTELWEVTMPGADSGSNPAKEAVEKNAVEAAAAAR